MDNNSHEHEFILNSFFSSLNFNDLPTDKKNLLNSIIQLHATHAELDLKITKSIEELYRIIIYVLKQYIKEGSASKEQKEILEKLKNITDSQESSLYDNISTYNKHSENLIESLKKIGIN